MTSARYLELCAALLQPQDAAAVAALSLGLPEEASSGFGTKTTGGAVSSFIKAWEGWEMELRLDLAALRAAKLKRDAPVQGARRYAQADVAAKAAFGLDNPLEAEVLLDKSRWDAAQEFAGIDNFGMSAICAYYIKLLLMERQASFVVEEGFERYKEIYDGVLQAYHTGQAESE
jgi:hypothetical protein